jgi:hypothetical protein
MALIYKVLGQSAPTTTSDANLYTVPASRSAIVSTLTISNTTATAATARVFVRVAAAATAASNAIIYDTNIPGNSIATFTLGITLATTDVITVRTGTADALTFQAFGTEVS